MRIPGGGSTGAAGTAEQTLEETQAWARLVNRFEKNGGQGVPLDFRVRVIGVKREHEVMAYDEATRTRVLKYWGKETPIEKRTVLRQKKDGTEYEGTMTEGCLITFEMVEPRFAGLRHYLECAWSGFANAALTKLGSAIYRRAIGDEEDVDPTEDYLLKEVIATISMGGQRTATCVDGSPVKGGHWWNVKSSFKPVPVDDDDDEDLPIFDGRKTDPDVMPRRRIIDGPATPATPKRELAAVGAAQAKRETSDDDADDDLPPF